ncbi:MAG: hypothetical protein NTV94_11445 [Planctomycetota bacterium]|nr:hypothetical protein [Planctomycetota bacterium]
MKLLLIMSVVSAVGAFAGSAVASPAFTIINPSGTGYTRLRINAVSGDGRYVGGYLENTATFRSTRWSADGIQVSDVGLLPGRPYSWMNALSFDGSVAVSDAFNTAYQPQAFAWTSPSTHVAISPPAGSSFNYSESISSDGSSVVGWTNLSGPPLTQRLWRWTAATGTTLLPTGLGFDLQATRILSGDGRYVVSGGNRYDIIGGGLINIASGSFTSPSITSISHDGTSMVGYMSGMQLPDGSYANHSGFVWSASGGLEDIGSVPGSRETFPRFMSGDGQTVLGTADGYAFIWSRSTGIVDFNAYLAAIGANSLGMTSLSFSGISDDGTTIAGMGYTAAGEFRGWVMTVPGPTSAMVLMLGGVCLSRRRRDPR